MVCPVIRFFYNMPYGVLCGTISSFFFFYNILSLMYVINNSSQADELKRFWVFEL